VRIAGRVPADQVHELYAETDVLLAPSIWPESFGLVTREALASGCWVVASDRGAMGEDVQPGVNGFVVDVSTIEGLLAALGEIDREPARYLRSPEHQPVLRSADEQAAEVLEVYRRVLKGRALGQRRRAARIRRDVSLSDVNQNGVAEGAQVGDSPPPRRRR
jgi:glycosyltransferase involved in cell wall biosynthesis